jgi:hypothetical protein
MLEAPVSCEPTGNSGVLFWEILLARCASQRSHSAVEGRGVARPPRSGRCGRCGFRALGLRSR